MLLLIAKMTYFTIVVGNALNENTQCTGFNRLCNRRRTLFQNTGVLLNISAADCQWKILHRIKQDITGSENENSTELHQKKVTAMTLPRLIVLTGWQTEFWKLTIFASRHIFEMVEKLPICILEWSRIDIKGSGEASGNMNWLLCFHFNREVAN